MSASTKFEHKRSDGKLPVIELFGPTIQGEGQLAGSLSHFVRFGGCDFRCSWCDSMHAVDPVQVHKNALWLSPSDIALQLDHLGKSPIVTFSGGNPALWDLQELIRLLDRNYYLNVETQGSIWQDWMFDLDLITVSPKGPSSGMFKQLDWDLLRHFESAGGTVMDRNHPWKILDVVFKVVVFNDEDFDFAQLIRSNFPDVTLYLSAGTDPQSIDPVEPILNKYRWLCEKVLQAPELNSVSVLPQIHQLIWPNQKGK